MPPEEHPSHYYGETIQVYSIYNFPLNIKYKSFKRTVSDNKMVFQALWKIIILNTIPINFLIVLLKLYWYLINKNYDIVHVL